MRKRLGGCFFGFALGPLLLGAAWGGQDGSDDEAAAREERVRASHELRDPDARVDELGLFVPVPISHPARRFPADAEFPTGPALGERLPDFSLPNQRNERVDFHEDRSGKRAAVVFQRSVVW